jgi:hypothetical protein
MRERVAAKPLLTRTEQQLYSRLVRAFPGHVILAHVALSRFLVADPMVGANGQAIANPGRQLVADFVVCRPDFTAVAVLELEDRQPEHPRRRDARHAKPRKDYLLEAAGIKIVRIASDDIPSELAIKSLVAALPVKAASAPAARRAS